MSGEKVTNTDEFLIKKKDALVLPPEYEKLPEPNSKKKKKVKIQSNQHLVPQAKQQKVQINLL